MAKDYLVEEVAGIEHEDGPRQSRALEAYVWDCTTWDRSAVHRQGKDEWVERNVVKKRRQGPFDSSARR